MRSFVLGLLAYAITLAATDTVSFTGTWRVDVNKTQAPKKPDQIEIANGIYKCLTCDPKLEVKADGQDHAVSNNPDFDTMNVKIVDDKVVEFTMKKARKVVSTGKSTISADNNHTVTEFTVYPPNSSEPLTGRTEGKRVGSLKPGMHAASGSWVMEKQDFSENGKEFTYEQTADGINAKSPTGFSYSAKFDGKDYPVTGVNALDSVTLKRVNDRTLEETLKYKGKVKSTNRMTLSPDGKTLTIEWHDPNGFSGKDVAERK